MLNRPQSPYYSLDLLNQLYAVTKTKCFSKFHCNIKSLPKNLSLLNELLHSLNRKPDILAITEKRLSAKTFTNIDLMNYEFFHTDSSTQAGGSGIYVLKTFNAIHRPDLKFTIPMVQST